jgi:hypothetical protein
MVLLPEQYLEDISKVLYSPSRATIFLPRHRKVLHVQKVAAGEVEEEKKKTRRTRKRRT